MVLCIRVAVPRSLKLQYAVSAFKWYPNHLSHETLFLDFAGGHGRCLCVRQRAALRLLHAFSNHRSIHQLLEVKDRVIAGSEFLRLRSEPQ